MRKIYYIILIIGVVGFSIALFAFWPKKEILELNKKEKVFNLPRDKSEEIFSKLSLDQKIGQMFMVGFEEKEITSEIEAFIKEIHPGGVLLLGRNIETKEQLTALIDSLQKIAKEDTRLPLFVAVDQEGGPISRISWAEKTPQSEINTEEEAYLIGKKRGKQLREIGVNLNLAPLLDIAYPEDFIFDRTFKANADISKKLGAGLIKGQKEAGIMVAIKHFPGYGGISFNPEEKLAFVEGLPGFVHFQETAKAGADMVMVSNVVYKALNKKLPLSFLKSGVGLLDKKSYLVISDDLSQKSLLNNFSLNEIVSLPINAGIDILIFSGWRSPVREGVLELRKAVGKEVNEETINRAVLRIIKQKQNYFNLF